MSKTFSLFLAEKGVDLKDADAWRLANPIEVSAFIMSAIRAERDKRLAATDYMAMPDYPSKPAGLAAYRQALRDFPATINTSALLWPVDVNGLNWPVLQ